MTQERPNKGQSRVIKLRPEPDLAERIDQAAIRDRQTSPNWVLTQIERVLATRAEQLEFPSPSATGTEGGR